MHVSKDSQRFRHTIPLLLCTIATLQQVTATRELVHHRILARETQSQCTKGYRPSTFDDPFTSQRDDVWEVKGERHGELRYTKDGLEMHTNQTHPATIIELKGSWGPPLNLSFSAKAQNFGGIVNSIAFLKFYEVGEIANASEIDLEIVPGQFQVPLWVESDDPKRAYRLITDSVDVKDDVTEPAVLNKTMTDSYAYSYPGYDPTIMTEYKLNWENDKITWHVGGQERVSFERLPGGKFPSGPLPLRIGPWATAQDLSWAGWLDWRSHPQAMFLIKDLTLEGCKSA